MKNIGRNDFCLCNSGKKYKNCCGHLKTRPTSPATDAIPAPNTIQAALEHHQAGRLAQAEAIYRQILQVDPDHPDALHFLGVIAYQTGNTASAIELYRKALYIKPDYAEAHYNLANTLQEQGLLTEAIAGYRNALTCKPDFAKAHNNLGLALKEQGNLDEALASYRQALRFKPDYAEAYNNLGALLYDQGHLPEACAAYQQALTYKPDFAEAYNNLGLTLKDQDKPDQAVICYRQSLELKPDCAETHYNLGNAYREQGKPDEAITCYYQALRFKPDSPEIYYNLGYALKERGKPDEAILSYQNAINYKPDYTEAYNNLGLALHELGKLTEAVASYQKALAFNPDHAELHNNLALALHEQCKLDEAVVCYRKALALKPDYVEAHSSLLFCLNYHPDLSAEAIFAEYRRWNELHAHPLLPRAVTHANQRNPTRRLRIGYVSPDMRKHSTRHFSEPLLARHDKTQVEVFVYAQVAVEDEVSAQLRGYSDHWTNTSGISDDEMADMIRRDGIDILVDLAGHTAKNRLLVFARKPAPIQISWMGYGYTTGMDAMDYFLSDRDFTPPGSETLFSEKLVRLPVAGVYRAPKGMGEPGPLPALKTGTITLGSLSRAIRINHRVIRAWAAILHRLPNARLMINSFNFQNEGMQRAIQSQFSAHGIAANRLVPGYETPPWDVLRQIDISLDCFPHNSGTTLWESLYMGVPFVTLAGRPSVGRSGALALVRINHPEWIAASEQEYVDKTVALASDLNALATLRAELRGKMQASLLMDEPAFVRSLETAYRTLWQRWCSGLAPANIGK